MELTDLKQGDVKVSEITLEDEECNSLTIAATGKNREVGYLKIYHGDYLRDPYCIEKSKVAVDSFISLLKESLYEFL